MGRWEFISVWNNTNLWILSRNIENRKKRLEGRERVISNVFKEMWLLDIFTGTSDLNMIIDLLVRLALELMEIKNDPVGSPFWNVFNGLLMEGIVGLAVIFISPSLPL